MIVITRRGFAWWGRGIRCFRRRPNRQFRIRTRPQVPVDVGEKEKSESVGAREREMQKFGVKEDINAWKDYSTAKYFVLRGGQFDGTVIRTVSTKEKLRRLAFPSAEVVHQLREWMTSGLGIFTRRFRLYFYHGVYGQKTTSLP